MFRRLSKQNVAAFAGGLALVGLALLASSRVYVWSSDDNLWRQEAMHQPSNARALINMHEVQLNHMDIQGHIETCEKLRALEQRGQLDRTEQWITDRICLSR